MFFSEPAFFSFHVCQINMRLVSCAGNPFAFEVGGLRCGPDGGHLRIDSRAGGRARLPIDVLYLPENTLGASRLHTGPAVGSLPKTF
jgi:hypothetical protein